MNNCKNYQKLVFAWNGWITWNVTSRKYQFQSDTEIPLVVISMSTLIPVTVHIMFPITLIILNVPHKPSLTCVLVRGALCTLVIHRAGGGGGEVTLRTWADEGGTAGVKQVLLYSYLHVPVISSYSHQSLQGVWFWHLVLGFLMHQLLMNRAVRGFLVDGLE